jgi:ATP-binding cassette subfamily B multidrug efflux pump
MSHTDAVDIDKRNDKDNDKDNDQTNGAASKPSQGTDSRDNYSAFDLELTHQALNFQLFARLLTWMRPYVVTLAVSVVLVIIAAAMMVLMPVITGRVIIDNILLPDSQGSTLPDYGLIAATEWLQNTLSIEALTAAGMLYVGLVLAQALFMFGHQLTLASCSLKALRDLRLDLFASLEHKPSSFYDHVAVGRVMTRVSNDIENLFALLTGFGMLAGEFVPFFLALFLMLHISSELTGIVLVALPVAGVATYIFRRMMSRIFRLIRDSVSALNQYMQEDLSGIDVVQLSSREAMNIEQYRERNQENRKQEFAAINYETIYDNFNNSLASLAIAGILWYGGGAVIQEEITLGAMVLFTQLVNMMITPIVALGQQFNTLFRSMASGERIFQALDWEEKLHEPDKPVTLPERLRGEVEFRNVHFGYYADDLILKDVSFTIAPGEKLAIVGPTGSGKSTIIRLLVRFYDFDDGMIFLDGYDVNQIASHDLRKRVGVVLQDFHIFSGTIRDNITLNDPAITNERAEWAARVVNADRFIRKLPNGYDTELGERGRSLSQGQRQLLAFARVLAGDPEILVLDEATASIDTTTELIIQDALHKLTEGRTSIIIAHRLQTIRECNRVLVLHHGLVREIGTHEELLEKKGIYYTLHELQFQDGAVAAETLGADESEQDAEAWQSPEEDEEESIRENFKQPLDNPLGGGTGS